MINVESSNVKAVDYDKETSTLHVIFKNDAHYTYDTVPEKKFKELVEAESIGKYLNKEIKGNYSFKRVN